MTVKEKVRNKLRSIIERIKLQEMSSSIIVGLIMDNIDSLDKETKKEEDAK